MSHSEIRLFLVSYDIACPRRLVKLHRFLKQRALPIQYSVFLARVTPPQIWALAKEIETRISLHEDGVRIYPIPSRFEAYLIGASTTPAGIWLEDTQLAPFLRRHLASRPDHPPPAGASNLDSLPLPAPLTPPATEGK